MPSPADTPWQQGDFYDHLAAAVDAVGLPNVGVAWGLAHVPWQSAGDREQFLAAITRVPANEAGGPSA